MFVSPKANNQSMGEEIYTVKEENVVPPMWKSREWTSLIEGGCCSAIQSASSPPSKQETIATGEAQSVGHPAKQYGCS